TCSGSCSSSYQVTISHPGSKARIREYTSYSKSFLLKLRLILRKGVVPLFITDFGRFVVPRADLHVFRQLLEQPFHRGEQFPSGRGREVIAAVRLTEQGVAADQHPFLWKIIADAPFRMAGRVKYPDLIACQ